MDLTILPFRGFEPVLLGITEDQAVALLGDPTSMVDEPYDDGTLNRSLEFEEIGVELTFSSEDDYRLTAVTFFSRETVLVKEKLIGLEEEEFVARLKASNIVDLVLESDFEDLQSKDYYSDALGMSFWVNEGALESITMYPAYEEDEDTIKWPESFDGG